jgi:hypothetical protein
MLSLGDDNAARRGELVMDEQIEGKRAINGT